MRVALNTTLNLYLFDNSFIAKYDAAGNALWATNVLNNNVSLAIASAGGQVYITGEFADTTVKFGDIVLTNGTTNGQFNDYFVAAYDTAGNALWAQNETGAHQCLGSAVAADAYGNVYVTGKILAANTATFGNTTLNLAGEGYDCFIVRYNATGNQVWAKAAGGGSPYGSGFCLTTDLNARIYLGAGFAGDSVSFDTAVFHVPHVNTDPVFLVTFDSTGKVICGLALPTGGDDQFGIAADRLGNIYVGADFEMNPFIIGSDTLHLTDTIEVDDTLSTEETENIYVAKYACTTCMQSNLTYSSSQSSICLGSFDTIALTGCSSYTITPANLVTWLDSSHALLSPDTTTIFTITGYSSCNVRQTQTFTLPVLLRRFIPITATKTALCPGDTAQICVPAGFSYIWSTGATSACITTDTAGSYGVTASVNNQCFASAYQGITAFSTSPFNINVHGDTLSYNNANSYQWFVNGNAITGATSSTYVTGAGGSYTLQITDSNGCPVLSNPIVILGINPINDYFISIYPNPSAGSWELQVDSRLLASHAEVFDATGKLVYQTTIASINSTIALPNAATGVYELRISIDAYSLVRKLVKL